MTIEQALAFYLVQLQANGRSQHTVLQARRHVMLLAEYVGPREVKEIAHQDVARFLASNLVRTTVRGELRKPGSTNALRSSIRRFFAYAHAAGLSRINAGALVRRALVGPRPPRGLTETEQKALLGELARGIGDAGERDRVLFGLILATGLRIGSALALEGDDVDLERGVLRLRTMKGGGEQEVPLPQSVVDLIRGSIRPGLLFPISQRQAHRRLQEVAELAGIKRKVSPHVLRHSYALQLYAQTSDIEIVRAALGHASIGSTSVYARATPSMVRQAVLRAVPAGP